MADVAVVCVGFNNNPGGAADRAPHDAEEEGMDRTYELPGGQEELIREARRLNPRTIVILNAGGAVATANWIGKIPVLLDAFYPGQEGGTAIGEILFGKTTPSGKLPFSWEKRLEDCPAYGNFPYGQQRNNTTGRASSSVIAGWTRRALNRFSPSASGSATRHLPIPIFTSWPPTGISARRSPCRTRLAGR